MRHRSELNMWIKRGCEMALITVAMLTRSTPVAEPAPVSRFMCLILVDVKRPPDTHAGCFLISPISPLAWTVSPCAGGTPLSAPLLSCRRGCDFTWSAGAPPDLQPHTGALTWLIMSTSQGPFSLKHMCLFAHSAFRDTLVWHFQVALYLVINCNISPPNGLLGSVQRSALSGRVATANKQLLAWPSPKFDTFLVEEKRKETRRKFKHADVCNMSQ